MGGWRSGDHSNPYARHTFSPGYETEITILLDGSDSMSQGFKLQRAASLALVVAQAAEQVGVKCEIVRFYGHKVISLKAPRERLGSPNVQARLAFASQSTSGSTPLTQSIALVRQAPGDASADKAQDDFCGDGRNLRHGAKRRQNDNRALRQRPAWRVIGLSIDSHVQGAFKFETSVNSNDDVAKAGLGVLVKALENRPGYANGGGR